MSLYSGSKEFFKNEIGKIDLNNLLNEDRIWNFLEEDRNLDEPTGGLSWINFEEGKISVFGRAPAIDKLNINTKLPVIDFTEYSDEYKEGISNLINDLKESTYTEGLNVSLSTEEEDLIIAEGEILGLNALNAANETLEESVSPVISKPGFVLLSELDREILENYNFGPGYEGDSLDIPNHLLGDDFFYLEKDDNGMGRAGTLTSDPTAIVFHLGNYIYSEHYSDENKELLSYLDEGLSNAVEHYNHF